MKAFVERLVPQRSEADLLVEEAAGADDPEPLLRRALELQPDHLGAITALAPVLVAAGDPDAAMALLDRIPETAETRRLLAEARLAGEGSP